MGDTGKGLVGRFRDLIGDVDGDGVNEGLGEGRAGSQKPTPAPAPTNGRGANDESGIINPFDPGAEEKIKAQTPRAPRRPKPEETDDETAAATAAPDAPPADAAGASTDGADDGFSFDDLGRISLSGVGEFLEEARRDIEDRAFPDLQDSDGEFTLAGEDAIDVDRDGVGDFIDEDVDGDGVLNVFDIDDDGDGVHDLLDPDDDGDGVRDRTERTAVAPHRESSGSLASDVNAITADDSVEPMPTRAGVKAAATEVVDPISRGFFGLGEEEFLPVEQLENDLDGDGTIDEVDVDTDGDGLEDTSDPDDDNDLITDINDTDDDGDGFLDRSEQRIRESAPTKGASADPAAPTDVAAEPEPQLAEASPAAPPVAPLVDEEDDFGTGAAVAAADTTPSAAEAAEPADDGGSFLTDAFDAIADAGRSALDALTSTFGVEADDTVDVAAADFDDEPVDEVA